MQNNKNKIDGQEITEILTVNGIRFSFKDGSWGLIRASSNKPSLVIVTESPTSEERKKKIFDPRTTLPVGNSNPHPRHPTRHNDNRHQRKKCGIHKKYSTYMCIYTYMCVLFFAVSNLRPYVLPCHQ